MKLVVVNIWLNLYIILGLGELGLWDSVRNFGSVYLCSSLEKKNEKRFLKDFDIVSQVLTLVFRNV